MGVSHYVETAAMSAHMKSVLSRDRRIKEPYPHTNCKSTVTQGVCVVLGAQESLLRHP